jgi:ferredoxin
MAITVDVGLCDGCGTCVELCPTAAIELRDGKAAVDEENCADCGACEGDCPTGAIQSP